MTESNDEGRMVWPVLVPACMVGLDQVGDVLRAIPNVVMFLFNCAIVGGLRPE